MKSDPGTPDRSRPLSARGGFIAAGVLAVIGVLIAAVPLIAASTGNPIEGGYKLLGDATSGVLFGAVFLIAAGVLAVIGVLIAAVPLIAASTGNPIEGGYKLLGDATSGVLFGAVFLIAAVVVLVQAVRIATRNRRRR